MIDYIRRGTVAAAAILDFAAPRTFGARLFATCTVAVLLLPHCAVADSPACRRVCTLKGETRPDISCRETTEALLLGLGGASRAQVIAAMGTKGSDFEGDGLHFLSLYGKGECGFSGYVNVKFDETGHASLVIGNIDQAGGQTNMYFIWNSEKAFLCSDFPGSTNRCYDKK